MAATEAPVGIIGLGHVGLSTAACFAAKGIPVVGIDVEEVVVTRVSRGVPPFFEKGLKPLLAVGLRNKKLRVTTDYEALSDSGIQFITVNTPSSPDGSTELVAVKAAAKSVGLALGRSESYKVVVVKSTVPPGTTDSTVRSVLETASGRRLGKFGLVANPEFVREGNAVRDVMRPDRLVIGAMDRKSENVLVSFYRRFYGTLPKTLLTTPVNAELIKYASNSFLATRVSFMNEIANLCAVLPGADVTVVAEGIGLDHRIGQNFLRAGLGYGGSCFPKDVRGLLHFSHGLGVELGVIAATQKSNEKQPLVAVRLAEHLIGNLAGKKIALLGLAFKPESDDMRDAVSLRLISELEKVKARIVAFDPLAIPNARKILGGRIEYSKSTLECLKGSDCCIIVTEWEEFSSLRPGDLIRTMRTPAVVDGRRVLNPEIFARSRVRFAAVGLSTEKVGSPNPRHE